ncbi:MAG: dockerin type I repeat-containing protein [Oscillospiraceae bacterium]|nr:dockerin type I repeat-containing protein [Oscillospiraceae bacterium]
MNQHHLILNRQTHLFLKRVISILIAVCISVGLLRSMPDCYLLCGHALGGIYEYEYDGMEYYVEWDDSEYGVGVCFYHCEYCSQGFGREFDDGDHEGCIADMLGEDMLECGHCVECAGDYHCYHCGGCYEAGDVEECPFCNSMLCIDCHEDTYYCDICGNCRLEDGATGEYLKGTQIHFPGCNAICDECFNDYEICVQCGNFLSFAGGEYCVYDELGMDWCPEHGLCGHCMEDAGSLEGTEHCWNCAACNQTVELCDECGLCENCAPGLTHCEVCEHCFNAEVEMCASDGDHCVVCCEDNDWICEQCGECAEAKGLEICPDCLLCEECCQQNSEDEGCTHGYCILSSDYEEHLCTECARCPEDTECEYCGMCENCAADYHCEHDICPDNDSEWEEHLCENCGDCFELDDLCEYCHMCESCWEHCEHDICPESSDYDDHFFCPECDDCFEDDEICEICGLCLDCCRRATLDLGCQHEICIKSAEFQKHYCFADFRCLEFCDHNDCEHADVDTIWSMNASSHWHICNNCGSAVDTAPHEAGEPVIIRTPNPLTRQNGVAKISCKECGIFMYTESIQYVDIPTDGSPYILSQPKDYIGRVSDFNTDPLRTTFTVLAAGENLTYQWYRYYEPQNKTTKLEDNDSIHGANSRALTVAITTEACHDPFGYYCVVSNQNGSVQSFTVYEKAHHTFNANSEYKRYDDGTHARICIGENCEVAEDRCEPHKFGDWFVYKVATAFENGIRRHECTVCGAAADISIAAVGKNHKHSYDFKHWNSKNHWLECKCGLKDLSTQKPHAFKDWETVKAATEMHSGQKKRSCTGCDYIEYAEIEKLPHTHNFTDVKDKKNGKFGLPDKYALPNGGFNSEYHYRFCTGCTSRKIEAHSYGPWHILHSSFTDKKTGEFHEGTAERFCTECGHSMQVSFSGKYPIMTWVYNPDSDYGYGGATINGAVAGDPGEKITLTVDIAEGYTFGRGQSNVSLYYNGWSLSEVRRDEGIEIYGKWHGYMNYEISDFEANEDGTATFTMPDGPIALMFMIGKCDHKDRGTVPDHVDPSCTGYGGNVLRCAECGVIVKEVTREDPIGHLYSWEKWLNSGDCYNKRTMREKCIRCGKKREKAEDYVHKLEKKQGRIEPSCKTPGHNEIDICTLCGTIIDPGPIKPIGKHDWGSWETLVKSTTRTKGLEQRKCEVCGEIETRKTDFSGPDYRIIPENSKLYFNYEYGDAVESQTVKIKSIGRDKVTSLMDVAANIGQYYDVVLGEDMQVTVTPKPTGIVIGGTSGVEQLIKIMSAKSDENGDLVSTPLTVVSNITYPKGRFHIALNGAKLRIYDPVLKDFETKERSEADLAAGTVVRITADNETGFRRWVMEDTGGMAAAWLKESKQEEESTTYLAIPSNDLTVTAADSTLKKANFTIPVPVAGEGMNIDYESCEADDYGIHLPGVSKWQTYEDGAYKDVSGNCEADRLYYLELTAVINGYLWNMDGDKLLTEITVNGEAPVKPAEVENKTLRAMYAVLPQQTAAPVTIAGKSLTIPYVAAVGKDAVKITGFEKVSGISNLTLKDNGDGTISVTIPENAKAGDYLYYAKLQIGDTAAVTAVPVKVTKAVEISFDANGGTGIMQPVKATVGEQFVLPECTFGAPYEMEFGSWEQGKPGEKITIAGDTVIKAQWVSHTHKTELVPAKEPTCTEYGNVEYYYCAGCGKMFNDATAAIEAPTVDFFLLPPTGHSLKPVPAAEPNCTEDGNTAYYACEKCGEWFEDEAGTKPITDHSKTVIAKKGHDWGDVSYVWADDLSSVTAKRVCKTDAAHIESEKVNTVKNEQAPTETEKGSITYTAKFTNPAFAEQKRVVEIPMLTTTAPAVTTTEKATTVKTTTTTAKQTTAAPKATTTTAKQTTAAPKATTTTAKQTTAAPKVTTTTAKQTTAAPKVTTTTAKETTAAPKATTTTAKQTTAAPKATTTTAKQTTAAPKVTTTTAAAVTTAEAPVTTVTSAKPEAMLSGDFNGDGSVSVADAVLLARFTGEDQTLSDALIGKILSANPDQDHDGFITIMDVAAILKVVFEAH